MKTRFNFPTRILFGPAVIEDLPQEIQALDATRPLLITDRGLMKTAIPENLRSLLASAGFQVEVFSDVSPNPEDSQVTAGVEAFLAHGADVLIALGGGSPIDAAKAVQLAVEHKEALEEYDDLKGGDAKITGKLPPLIAIPTTAGTGSEVSRSAVITVRAVDRKVVLFSPRLMPRVALCDPELTRSLPPSITAETGMDALSHNVEAFLSKGYHPMADGIAFSAISMIASNLPVAVADGNNINARAEMMMASTMGAVAFQKGLGVIHSLAHPLSSVSGLSHGLANAILMPHALRFNAQHAATPVIEVGKALCGKEVSVEQTIQAVTDLIQRLGLPSRLSAVGAQESQLDALVEKSMQDGCHLSNPRPCQPEDMRALLRAAW